MCICGGHLYVRLTPLCGHGPRAIHSIQPYSIASHFPFIHMVIGNKGHDVMTALPCRCMHPRGGVLPHRAGGGSLSGNRLQPPQHVTWIRRGVGGEGTLPRTSPALASHTPRTPLASHRFASHCNPSHRFASHRIASPTEPPLPSGRGLNATCPAIAGNRPR